MFLCLIDIKHREMSTKYVDMMLLCYKEMIAYLNYSILLVLSSPSWYLYTWLITFVVMLQLSFTLAILKKNCVQHSLELS